MARSKEFVEEEALQKAMQVFWLKGYHNTSMQDLVDGMAISRASLYDTFGDKHALYIKALAYYRSLNCRDMEQAISQASANLGKINVLFSRLIEEIVEDVDQKGCFITNSTLEMLPEHEQTVGKLVCSNFSNLEATITRLLRDGMRSGEFRADLPVADTALFLLGTIGGLRIVGKVQPDRNALEGMIRIALSVLD